MEKLIQIFKSVVSFKAALNIWVLIGLIILGSIVISFPQVAFNRYLTNKKIDAERLSIQSELTDIKAQLESYKNEIVAVVRIRDNYRSSIKDIIELLYTRDTHLGIGGYSVPITSSGDEINILTIRNIIASMEDDQRLLSEAKNYLEVRRQFVSSLPYIWPVDTRGVPHISSGYGFRDSPLEEGGLSLHAGIDIDLPIGTPVLATADGQVVYNFYDEKMGYMVILRHQHGFTTTYAHLDKSYVRLNQNVKRGDIIAAVGNSGMSTGSHLHYEIRQNNISLDPMIFLTTNF